VFNKTVFVVHVQSLSHFVNISTLNSRQIQGPGRNEYASSHASGRVSSLRTSHTDNIHCC